MHSAWPLLLRRTTITYCLNWPFPFSCTAHVLLADKQRRYVNFTHHFALCTHCGYSASQTGDMAQETLQMQRNSCADPAKLPRVAEHTGIYTGWGWAPVQCLGEPGLSPTGCPQPTHPSWACTPDFIPGAAQRPCKVRQSTQWTHLLCCLNKLSCFQPFCTQFQITTTG